MKNAPYNVGEIAGFPPEIAKRLIDRKRAVPYVPPEEEKPVVEPPAKSEPEPEPKAKPKAKAKKKTVKEK
jgi:hypothetical protein